MILGQLYYYEKQIESLNPDFSNLKQVDILGVSPSQMETLSKEEITDIFIKEMYGIFDREGHVFNQKFWNYLKSVYKDAQLPTPNNTFQETVVSWLDHDNDYSYFQEILQEGVLTTNERDFSLYYALKVLNKLLQFENLSSYSTSEILSGKGEIKDQPPILCITNSKFFPLYKNYDIIYKEFVDDYDVLVVLIKEVLEQHQLELILIDTQNEELVAQLKKKFKLDSVVSSFSMTDVGSSGFFDILVKDTLGVRLA